MHNASTISPLSIVKKDSSVQTTEEEKLLIDLLSAIIVSNVTNSKIASNGK